MSTDTIVPFRPRHQVARRIGTFRSDPTTLDTRLSQPVRIDGSVTMRRFMDGLRKAGLDFKRDDRTSEFVILPKPGAQP